MTRRVAMPQSCATRANARTTDVMRKKTPETSKLTRSNVLPYTRTSADASDTRLDVAKNDKKVEKDKAEPPKQDKTDAPKLGDGPKSATSNDPPTTIDPIATPHDVKQPVVEDAPKLGDGPKSATRNELPTERETAPISNEQPTERETRPIETADLGAPPEMPKGTVEDPTHMPGPRAIPEGSPSDPALPPGHVPPGDSRSFRRGGEFALVYRQANAVIMRFGTVGQRGQWRVVEYPTTASASHAYAKECSRFVAEGFSDYR